MNLYGWHIMFGGREKHHYVNGKLHNDNGPAIISKRHKEWRKQNKLHREDGPAIECVNGDNAWWYNGECLGHSEYEDTQEKFEQWLRLRAFI